MCSGGETVTGTVTETEIVIGEVTIDEAVAGHAIEGMIIVVEIETGAGMMITGENLHIPAGLAGHDHVKHSV